MAFLLTSKGEGQSDYEEAGARYHMVYTNSAPKSHRLHFLNYITIACLVLSLPLFVLVCKQQPRTLWNGREVADLLRAAPLIDGHDDLAIWTRAFYQNHIYRKNFTSDGDLFGQVDFPRLRKGRLRGQFWSVYVECPKQSENDTDDEIYREIIHDTLQQIDLIHRLVAEFPQHLQHAFSASDVRHNFANSVRISSLMGIEGLHQIGNSASILRMYHRLGVRYATLTHTCHNRYADSEAPRKASHHGGLSEMGLRMITEMNRIGMMVDLSHTSFATQRAALRTSRAPVIFSHSNAYAVCPHTRNAPDNVLWKLKANDGIIMATFYPEFVHENSSAASLRHVADHIQYIGELIGYRHVGIGSDFDGMARGPLGLEDVSKYPDLLQELLDRGIAPEDVQGVMGLNVLRVLAQVEKVSRQMQMAGVRLLEDDVKPFFE